MALYDIRIVSRGDIDIPMPAVTVFRLTLRIIPGATIV